MFIATTTQQLGLLHCYDSMAKIGYSDSVCYHHGLPNHAPTLEHTAAMCTEDGRMATKESLLIRSGSAVEHTVDPHLHVARYVHLYIHSILHASPLLVFDGSMHVFC